MSGLNIVIVGHVDHGKSTLIGRLLYDTGSVPEEKLKEIENTCAMLGHKMEFSYVADALEEERKKEMTIETTQTFFKSSKRDYTIIDAPGHKEFLKNMVTGASQAEASILIVDVTRGAEEQTMRHAYILKLLGIDRVILAVNKMDLINYDKEKYTRVARQCEKYLRAIGITLQHMIPVSAYNGDNIVKPSQRMNWYKGPTILEALDSLDVIRMEYDFRLPVQDHYTINGDRVYVGNILSGCISRRSEVTVYPWGENAVVKEILTFEGRLEKACRPKAIGLILSGFSPKRGDIIARGGRPTVAKNVRSTILCLIGEVRENESYLFRCTTQEVKCKVRRIEDKVDVETLERLPSTGVLKQAEIGTVYIEFEHPVVLERVIVLPELGRFVLLKNGIIVAGGIYYG
ncbi:MAG TPA: GTP-binding protein [Candidatus Bathyarchaeota archaeon]|nr:GTP-binding protein [Candidatus Bathyarchaeota archaeon]